jgi:hypothetical protein
MMQKFPSFSINSAKPYPDKPVMTEIRQWLSLNRKWYACSVKKMGVGFTSI